MKRIVSFAVMSIAFAFVSLAQESPSVPKGGNTGILYGENHAYSLTAPQGWVLDNQAGVDQGIHAVFYPVGFSWAKAPAVMYTSVWMKDAENPTLKAIMENDVKAFNERAENLKVTEAPDIGIGKDKKALVRYFTGDVHGNFEAIAYIDEEKLVVLVVLSSNNSKDFESTKRAFESLVKSYYFLTANVVIEKKTR